MDLTVLFQNVTQTLQIIGCTFLVKPSGYEYPLHHHALFELVHCVSGKIREQIGPDNVVLRPGDWLLIKSGMRHNLTTTSEGEHTAFFNAHFDLDSPLLRRRLSASNFVHVPFSAAARTRLPSYMEEIDALIREGMLDRRSEKVEGAARDEEVSEEILLPEPLALQAYLLLIVKELLALPDREKEPDGYRERSIGETDLAHRIEARLRDGLYRDDTISTIARELNVSASQCGKIFSRTYGISPRQYVSRMKLNEAKRLLVNTNLSVQAVSERLGFHSVYHFSRQFRRWTGTTPTAFRPKTSTPVRREDERGYFSDSANPRGDSSL